MNQLREFSRSLRRVPLVRDVIERTDPPRRIARLLQSGLVDPVLYAAQLGEEKVTAAYAAQHYIRWGYRRGFAINVLIDNFVLKEGLPATPRPLVYDYLAAGDWRVPVSLVWDAPAYLREHPDAATHPGGPVGHLWQRAQKDPEGVAVEVRDAAGTRSVPWRELYETALGAIGEWAIARADRQRRRPNSFVRKSDHKLPAWDTSRPEPLVSIVMATWNRAAGMRTAVESVQAQTWGNWELIVADDGSWDDTAAVADLLALRDPRVRVLHLPHAGVSAARNAGIAEARGEFVAFLDSDNEWEHDFLAKIIPTMVADEDQVAFSTIKMVYEDRVGYRQNEPTYESLLLGNSVDLNTVIVRTTALREIDGFDETLPRAVDFDVILRLAERHRIRHVPFVGAVYDNRDEASDRISTSEPMGWNTVVRLRAQPAVDPERPLESGTTVLAILNRRDADIGHKLRELIDLTDHDGMTVIAAFVAPTREEWMAGAMARLGRPRLGSRLFVERESYAYVVDTCLADLDRARVVVLGPTAHFDAASVRILADSVDPATRKAVMPTVVQPHGLIVGLGADFPKPGAAPEPLLRDHPYSDAVAAGPVIPVPALHGDSFAMPTRDLLHVGGIDPLLYNQHELPVLALRLLDAWPDYAFEVHAATVWRRLSGAELVRTDPVGSRKVAMEASRRATPGGADVYARIGQELTGWRTGSDEADASILVPVVARRPAVGAGGTPRLRWAIKIAAPFGPVGEAWGDTHFARSLAAALERLGQEVVIDFHLGHERPSSYLDDVTLVLRGLDDHRPVTSGTSILWIISHPDMVTRGEATAFDRVFAASSSWSAEWSERWDLRIDPLLQCTDPTVFHPRGLERSDDVVFVGNSRGISRPAVVEPVRAGIPVRVYGGEWAQYIPSEQIVAERVPNAEVAPLYESAGVVLNDHWRDMQRDGFMSNRLFDVVAAGGRVLSDEVAGLDEVFGSAVATYSSPGDLVAKLTSGVDSLFPDAEALAAASEAVRRDHSFDARARVLLDSALEHRDRA